MTDTLQFRQAAPSSTPAHLEPSAGEHAFNAPVAFNVAAGPTVVVKRKKTLDHAAHSTPAPQEPGDAERLPRVFRVVPAVQDAESNGAGTLGTWQRVMDDSQPAVTDAVRAAARARRRRRVPRPPVTIIRPGSDGTETIHEPSGSRDAPTLPSVGVEHELRFGQSQDDHHRYVELQREIEALQREAETLRKAEAAGAVRWIRKAIARYGIGAAELGL